MGVTVEEVVSRSEDEGHFVGGVVADVVGADADCLCGEGLVEGE